MDIKSIGERLRAPRYEIRAPDTRSRSSRYSTMVTGSRSWRSVHLLSWWCSRFTVYFSTYSVRNFSPPLSWTMTALSFAATKCGRPAGIRTKLPVG
jgi:hypothetical protein